MGAGYTSRAFSNAGGKDVDILRERFGRPQRLKRLEARVKPADEPLEIVIHLIGPDGEVTGTLVMRGSQKEWRTATVTPVAAPKWPHLDGCLSEN